MTGRPTIGQDLSAGRDRDAGCLLNFHHHTLVSAGPAPPHQESVWVRGEQLEGRERVDWFYPMTGEIR